MQLRRQGNNPWLYAVIDAATYENVRQLIWMAQWSPDSETFYVVTLGDNCKKVYLHRLLTNAPDGMQVDHIDHDGLNNRLSNLRIVTRSDNQLNRRGSRKASKSGIPGVHWNKRRSTWHVRFMRKGVITRLGNYASIEEATNVARGFNQ